MQIDLLWRGPLLQRHLRANLGLHRPVRLAYLSDLHYAPWCGQLLQQITACLEEAAVELVLFGGDLVDLPWGHDGLRQWLRKLGKRWPLCAVPGNHDRYCGLERVKQSLGALSWLDEQPLMLASGLRLCGDIRQGATSRSIFVGHEPSAVRSVSRAGFGHMLAGHLHGCQWIAFHRNGLDYPGAWMFAFHGAQFDHAGTRLWVSRGVSDTLPLRVGCPREILILEVS